MEGGDAVVFGGMYRSGCIRFAHGVRVILRRRYHMIATLSEMLSGPNEDLAIGSKGETPDIIRAASSLMEVEESVGVDDDVAAPVNEDAPPRRLPFLLAPKMSIFGHVPGTLCSVSGMSTT